MDLLQQPEASVSLLQIFIFFTVSAPLHLFSLCPKNDIPATFKHDHPLFKMTSTSARCCNLLKILGWPELNRVSFDFFLFCVFPPTGNIILCFTFDLHIRPQWCLPTFLVSWKLPGGSSWPVPWSSACECFGHAKVTAWSIEVQDLQLPISHAKRENIPEPSSTPTLDLVKVYPNRGWTLWNFLNFMSTDWSGNF